MIFKDPQRHSKEFWLLDPKLRKLLTELDYWAYLRGEEVCITSLIRTKEEQVQLINSGAATNPTSVHLYGRGADIRPFKNEETNILVDWVNEIYQYDPTRLGLKTMIRHKGTGDHYHLQVLETKTRREHDSSNKGPVQV